jgi:hypothetical protein
VTQAGALLQGQETSALKAAVRAKVEHPFRVVKASMRINGRLAHPGRARIGSACWPRYRDDGRAAAGLDADGLTARLGAARKLSASAAR